MTDSPQNIPDSQLAAGDSNGAEIVVEAAESHDSKRRVSVVSKVTWLVALSLSLLLVVLLAGTYFYWRAVLRRTVDEKLTAAAGSRRDFVQAQLSLMLQRVELYADHGEFRAFLFQLEKHETPTAYRDLTDANLQKLTNGQPVVAAAIADKDGVIQRSTNPAEVGQNVSERVGFKMGLSQSHLGVPHWENGRFEASISAPIRARPDPTRIFGVLLTTANVNAIANALKDPTGLGLTGEALLGVRENGQLRFLFPPRNAPDATLIPLDSTLSLKAATMGAEYFGRNKDYRGVPVLAVGRPIPFQNWGLVVKMDEKEAYAPVGQALGLGALFGLAVGGVGLAAAWALARSFLRPLREVTQAARRVRSGEFGSSVPVNSADEFGALSTSFNEMAAAIDERRRERDQAESALRATEEQLRLADRRKDEFLAMLGHELRNPLSAIASAVRLWRDADGKTHDVELARTVIERQTGNLGRHVDDLLDVARVSQGKIELRRQPTDLGKIIERAIDAFRLQMEEKEEHLELSLSQDGEWQIDADPARIEQIVTNLLNNAVKYTPSGGHIRVSESYLGDDAIVTVTDDGSGIDPSVMPEIFELFTQADRSLHRVEGGLGIGLHLCRQLAELHGGSISARSEGLGRGAEFTLRLPAQHRTPAISDPPPVASPTVVEARRRILIVDDNKDTVRLLSRLLTRRGHEVLSAYDGLEALRSAEEFQPDVLLLDIGLPGLDGYELARRLRAQGFAHALIVAISGYAQDHDRELAREAGFDQHFAKPVDVDALLALIAVPRPERGGSATMDAAPV